MQIRPQPPARGWAWFVQAINLGTRNPRAIFGAALLLIGTLYLLTMAAGLLMTLMPGGRTMEAGQFGVGQMAVMVLLMVALFVLIPMLVGGLMYVIREAESGRPARAADLFRPIRDGKAGRLAAFGALQVGFMWLGGLVANALVGDEFMRGYAQFADAVMQQQVPPELPPVAHPMALFAWQALYNYVTVTVLLLGIACVALSGRSFVDAVRAAFRATWRNLLPNLLAAALFLAATALAAVVVTLVGSVVLVALGMLSSALALAVGLLAGFAFVSAVLVVVCGGGYLIWRDTFDDGEDGTAASAPPPPPPHQLEA